MQVLVRDCVPEPQVTLHGLHSDHGKLPGGRPPIVRSKIIIIIIIIIIINNNNNNNNINSNNKNRRLKLILNSKLVLTPPAKDYNLKITPTKFNKGMQDSIF